MAERATPWRKGRAECTPASAYLLVATWCASAKQWCAAGGQREAQKARVAGDVDLSRNSRWTVGDGVAGAEDFFF
eukprot:scaffold237_cov233-Pinguiococcus_pyrenoidosus.AAC.11